MIAEVFSHKAKNAYSQKTSFKRYFIHQIFHQVVNVPQGAENLEKDVFRLLFLGPASIFSFPH